MVRATASRHDPGGKAINVASCLADWGVKVIVTGLLGQENAASFEQLFAQKGIADRMIRVAGATRTNIKILEDGGRTTDVNLPGMDGFELFQRLHQMDPDRPVILLTGHADVPMAGAALKQGAYDFLSKPVGADQLAASLNRACQSRALVMENRALKRDQQDAMAEQTRLIGHGAAMQHLRGSIGPQGRDAGRLEKAHQGTLYLDGIDMLAPALQARLLELIAAGEFWPAGAAAPRPLDLWVIVSVGADPERRLREGALRGDLYYRLSGVTLHLPPLTERREDVLNLFRHFLLDAGERLKLPSPPMTPADFRAPDAR